jgi:hypothetical protein
MAPLSILVGSIKLKIDEQISLCPTHRLGRELPVAFMKSLWGVIHVT